MPPNLATLPSAQPVNCWQCQHFATSWDPKLPYQCKLLGFKSRNLPNAEVMAIDGRACQGFAAKARLQQSVG